MRAVGRGVICTSALLVLSDFYQEDRYPNVVLLIKRLLQRNFCMKCLALISLCHVLSKDKKDFPWSGESDA